GPVNCSAPPAGKVKSRSTKTSRSPRRQARLRPAKPSCGRSEGVGADMKSGRWGARSCHAGKAPQSRPPRKTASVGENRGRLGKAVGGRTAAEMEAGQSPSRTRSHKTPGMRHQFEEIMAKW